MKKAVKVFMVLVALLAFFNQCVLADTLNGNVKEDAQSIKKNQVVDSTSGAPVDNAQVSIPSKGYTTNTDKNGRFNIDTKVDKKSILSVEKDGYRPFSITIDETTNSKPLKLGISQSKSGDITIENSLCHLGDDLYSDTSANSADFKTKAAGPFYSNRFTLSRPRAGEDAVLILGSIIGLDTKMAKELGQNSISQVYSSPAEVYFNGQKIGELHINGDNQEIIVPAPLINETGNEVTIKTGRNLFQHAYVDYDDLEFMNLRLEVRERPITASY